MSVRRQECTGERALHPTAATLETAPRPRLAPLYYLHNFRLALNSLKLRYCGLLGHDEQAFIEHFAQLPLASQCLIGRLVMRKGPLFRRATLTYVEIPDLDTAMQPLAQLGWLDLHPRPCAQELVQVLNREELRLVLGTSQKRPARRAATSPPHPQLSLPLVDPPAVRRSLHQWHPHLEGTLVRLCVDTLVTRLQLLFFGNPRQSWAEFVLADLGVSRYESVVIDTHSRPFSSREEIEHFYRLYECRTRLQAAEPAHRVLESALIPEAASDWLRTRFVDLHLRLADRLVDEGATELALVVYRACANAEGYIRAARLQLRLKLRDSARCDALAGRQVARTEAQAQAIERILARLDGRKISPGSSADESPTVTELVLPKLRRRQRIELAVAEHLGRPESPLFYIENSLLTSLFGLLCWEALFAPVPGAFFHPFQAGPADLHTPQFRLRREAHFQSLLGLLHTGQHEETIRRHHRMKSGIRNPFVRWSRIRPKLLTLALQCIPAPHLNACFQRILEDPKSNRTGLPDLIQFWPEERRYRLIEVKAPGDRLQDNQRRWLRFFSRHDIPATVCQVSWRPAPT